MTSVIQINEDYTFLSPSGDESITISPNDATNRIIIGKDLLTTPVYLYLTKDGLNFNNVADSTSNWSRIGTAQKALQTLGNAGLPSGTHDLKFGYDTSNFGTITYASNGGVVYDLEGTNPTPPDFTFNKDVIVPSRIIALTNGLSAGSAGTESICIGTNSGNNLQGSDCIAIGRSAGQSQQNNQSISIGLESGGTNQGDSSICIGVLSGYTNQGPNSIGIGFGSANFQQGTQSVALGFEAGYTNQGTNSIGIGSLSGNNTQGTDCIAIGRQAGQFQQNNQSIAIGVLSGNNTQGPNSIGIGNGSANFGQGEKSIALGFESAYNNQGTNCISIGNLAGTYNQVSDAIAIGNEAGSSNQGLGAVAIGRFAGGQGQGVCSIAIGCLAGEVFQSNNSIVLNASGNNQPALESGFFVNPVRNTTGGSPVVVAYDTTNNEFIQVMGQTFFYGYTVASLPVGVLGNRAYVTDALTPSYNASVVGGGTDTIPVFYNGTNWVCC